MSDSAAPRREPPSPLVQALLTQNVKVLRGMRDKLEAELRIINEAIEIKESRRRGR